MSGQEDAEQGPLVEKNKGNDAEAGKPKKSPDWSRFGLSQEQQASTQKHYDSTVDTGDIGQQNELYREEQVRLSSGCDFFSLPAALPLLPPSLQPLPFSLPAAPLPFSLPCSSVSCWRHQPLARSHAGVTW